MRHELPRRDSQTEIVIHEQGRESRFHDEEWRRMTATIIDGNVIAKSVGAQWGKRVQSLARGGVAPGLAVVMIDDNAAS